MSSNSVAGLRALSRGLVVLALLLLPVVALAQASVTVQLDPIGDSGVSGTATLTADGEGTDVALSIKGLPADAEARATMQAGTCAEPSASFAELPDLAADASGNATANGRVLFRGSEDVALATMADGEHIVSVETGGQVVACGVIPAQTLPESGAAVFPVVAGVAGALGLCALAAGQLLRPRR